MTDQEQPGREVAARSEVATGSTPGNGHGNGHGALRVSHEDRDQVAEVIRIAAGDGRLTADELDERLEKALTARTFDDLAVLVADLPAAGTALAPLPGQVAAVVAAGVPPAPPKELITIHVASGSNQRTGRWVVPARMDLKATSGSIKLDFTEAVISQPALHIDAEVRSGSIRLITKPGIAVDMDDVSVRSGSVKVRAPWEDTAPAVLRITVAGKCGSGAIFAGPPRAPRRSFWQWLRRAPRRQAITA